MLLFFNNIKCHCYLPRVNKYAFNGGGNRYLDIDWILKIE